MAFCIKRQPIVVSSINGLQAHKSLAAPLQLPAGSVIDLTGSAAPGVADPFGPSTTPICVVFGPSGAVDSVFYNGVSSKVSQPIYLLVGTPDKARFGGQLTGAAIQYNWQDDQNKWVVINPQSGLVTTAPVGSTTNSVPSSFTDARGLAGQAELLGGK